jgi:hypothetical protein
VGGLDRAAEAADSPRSLRVFIGPGDPTDAVQQLENRVARIKGGNPTRPQG